MIRRISLSLKENFLLLWAIVGICLVPWFLKKPTWPFSDYLDLNEQDFKYCEVLVGPLFTRHLLVVKKPHR